MIKIFAAIGFAATTGVVSICSPCGASGNPSGSSMSAGNTFAAPAVTYAAVALRTVAPETAVVTLKVTGMTCGGCVFGVRKVLERVSGVTKAAVRYDKGNSGSAVVTYDPEKASVEQMITAIKTLGYTAVVTGSTSGSTTE